MRTYRFRIYEIPAIQSDGDRLVVTATAFRVGARGGEHERVELRLTICSWGYLADLVVKIRQQFLQHKIDSERSLARIAGLMGRAE